MSNEERSELKSGPEPNRPLPAGAAAASTRAWHGSVNGHAQATVVVGSVAARPEIALRR